MPGRIGPVSRPDLPDYQPAQTSLPAWSRSARGLRSSFPAPLRRVDGRLLDSALSFLVSECSCRTVIIRAISAKPSKTVAARKGCTVDVSTPQSSFCNPGGLVGDDETKSGPGLHRAF